MLRTINFQIPHDDAIIRTLEMSVSAYNMACRIGFEHKVKNRNELHHLCYRKICERYPELPTDLVCQQLGRALESLRAVKFKRCPIGKLLSARYSKSSCTLFSTTNVMSVATVDGRRKFEVNLPKWAKDRYDGWKFKNITMTHKKGRTMVHFVIEHDDPPKAPINSIVGIDRGIVNIATCSNNKFYNSKHLKKVKGRYQHLRSVLQSVGTPSAKRKLKRISERERRFVNDTNHCIAKMIVNMPFDAFVLENLKKIKKRDKGRRFNAKLGGWSYYDLQTKIEYKANAVGKTVLYVNPAYTSQRCSRCGHTEKSNRHGSVFKCKECGFELNADLNASRNIADRGKLLLAGCLQPTECIGVATSDTIPQPCAGGS